MLPPIPSTEAASSAERGAGRQQRHRHWSTRRSGESLRVRVLATASSPCVLSIAVDLCLLHPSQSLSCCYISSPRLGATATSRMRSRERARGEEAEADGARAAALQRGGERGAREDRGERAGGELQRRPGGGGAASGGGARWRSGRRRCCVFSHLFQARNSCPGRKGKARSVVFV